MAARTIALVQMNRWVILAGFALLTACTQWLWLAYAPITTQTHQLMALSEGAAGDLAVIFPLVCVMRPAEPTSYGWAMVGQLVTAAGQPFVLNSITKVAGRYFPARERTLAVSVGSVALYAGILTAVLSGGPLLRAGGPALLLRVQAAAAVVAALWVLAAVRAPAEFAGDPPVAVSLRWLRGDGFMCLLARLLFVGMGVFNAVATWLDSILTHFGHGGASGALIAIMTVGGVAGGALLPGIVARRDQRRGMLETAVVVAGTAFILVAVVHTPVFGGVALFVAGFSCWPACRSCWTGRNYTPGPNARAGRPGFCCLPGTLAAWSWC